MEQNREFRKKSIYSCGNLIYDKGHLSNQWGVSNRMGLLATTWKKKLLNPYLIQKQKKPVKVPKENPEHFYNVREAFLSMTWKTISHKVKSNNFDNIKVKNFCVLNFKR